MYSLIPETVRQKRQTSMNEALFGQLSNVFCQVYAANQHSNPSLSTPEAEAGASWQVESIWGYIRRPCLRTKQNMIQKSISVIYLDVYIYIYIFDFISDVLYILLN